MREYKASTKRGQALISMGERCCWRSLYNLYDKWSQAKQQAFDWCWEQYVNDNQFSKYYHLLLVHFFYRKVSLAS